MAICQVTSRCIVLTAGVPGRARGFVVYPAHMLGATDVLLSLLAEHCAVADKPIAVKRINQLAMRAPHNHVIT
jgi:hypothetical protein